MSRINDLHYINQVIRGLNGKQKKDNLFNFKCNRCGDGNNGNKRGYFFLNKKGNGFSYTCHNCGESDSFYDWLKQYDNSLFQDYIYEIMSEKREMSSFSKKLVEKPKNEEYDLTQLAKPTFNKGKSHESESDIENYETESEKGFTTQSFTYPKTDSNEEIEIDSYTDDTEPYTDKSTNGSEIESNHDELPTSRPNFTGKIVDVEIQDLSELEFETSQKAIHRPNLENLRSISDLQDGHGAKTYLEKRAIPERYFDKLYIVWRFYQWCNEWKPDSFSDYMVENYDEPRLIIPFYDQSGELMMIQGRSFKKDAKIRYFSIKCDDDFPKIYGLEQIDKNKIVQVWEGPIDSMFGENAVAMAGADANPSLYFDDYVTVYDNEPRSPEICKRIEREIKRGGKVVIWPNKIPEKYDGNDMIMKLGLSESQLNDIIKENTFSGLDAQLKFSQWSKSASKRKLNKNTRNQTQFNL